MKSNTLILNEIMAEMTTNTDEYKQYQNYVNGRTPSKTASEKENDDKQIDIDNDYEMDER